MEPEKDEFIKKLLFALAFVEGGAVMCIELSSAKILSPYFGTSIYVWASVLGVTLSALMSGYYLGGYISSNYKKKAIVYWLMLIGGVLIILTPLISGIVLPYTIRLNLLIGSVFSLLSFLFIPLMLFGATSPLIINLITRKAEGSGKSSGTVYAVSTLGGIIVTFTIGFYTFPQFGITKTLYIYGLLVILTSLVLFFVTKTFRYSVLLILLVGGLLLAFQKNSTTKEVIYKSEGILGEIKVVDRELRYMKDSSKIFRDLMVNNVSQSIMSIENPEDNYADYINVLTKNILKFRKGDKVLLLGLGGGTLYKQLIKSNLNIDIVELDARIELLAKKYFFIEDSVKVIVDDARHFINTTDKKYDIIIYDLYHSETPPIHLLTKEAFQEIRETLNEGGFLAINFYGFIEGRLGKGARSIYKTLIEQGFNIRLLATPGEEAARNLVFICKKGFFDKRVKIDDIWIKSTEIDLENAVVLDDDKPILEHIYLEAALIWRSGYNEVNTKYFLNN